MRLIPVLVLPIASATLLAQHPFEHYTDAVELRYARSHPVVAYSLRVDSADLSGFEVEMRLRNLTDTFRLAMAAHPEYDDRYWRFVEGVRVTGVRGEGTVARLDSALWRVVAPGGEATVRYRIRLPEPEGPPRASWRPFLAPTGALVGGPHSFMYVLGAELGPSHVELILPAGWEIATGLTPTADPRVFFAPSVDALVDSPVLVGRLRNWHFRVDGVPHRVAYWPLPDAVPFDTVAFVGEIEGLARQAVALFGRAPYREYTFLYQDGAYGGLEHANSVTLGAPSRELAEDRRELLGEAAHEYVHTWNLVRIRPAGRGAVDYRPGGSTRGLWFSEGLTMFYADLLPRRAGVRMRDSTRLVHLERLLGRYLANVGNTHVSPERASLVAYGVGPGALGDYDPSVHAQGEVLGSMLDFIVRDATGGSRTMDDVMRAMLERFSGRRGFTGADVERTVADVCRCPVRAFFEQHVRGARPLDLDRWLRPLGLRARVTWEPALDRDGTPFPDRRMRIYTPRGETAPRLVIGDPGSVWGRAGLHTGDVLTSLNGVAVSTWPQFREIIGRARIGDTVRIEIARPTGPLRRAVVITGYQRPVVRIEELPNVNERQRRLRERWLAGH